MGPNRREQDRERAAARAAAEPKRAEAERKATADAQKVVVIWNARQADGRALWSTRRLARPSQPVFPGRASPRLAVKSVP